MILTTQTLADGNMRSYRIEDLTEKDVAALRTRLEALELHSGMDDMYWLPVGEQHLSAVQHEHAAQCGPYAMALELTEDALHLELLVRARNKLRCECVHYASPELEAHMMRYVDDTLRQLNIPF